MKRNCLCIQGFGSTGNLMNDALQFDDCFQCKLVAMCMQAYPSKPRLRCRRSDGRCTIKLLGAFRGNAAIGFRWANKQTTLAKNNSLPSKGSRFYILQRDLCKLCGSPSDSIAQLSFRSGRWQNVKKSTVGLKYAWILLHGNAVQVSSSQHNPC